MPRELQVDVNEIYVRERDEGDGVWLCQVDTGFRVCTEFDLCICSALSVVVIVVC